MIHVYSTYLYLIATYLSLLKIFADVSLLIIQALLWLIHFVTGRRKRKNDLRDDLSSYYMPKRSLRVRKPPKKL